MKTQRLRRSPPRALATRDDIDLPLLEREFAWLPRLDYSELREKPIDFAAYPPACRLSAEAESMLFRQMHLAWFRADTLRDALRAEREFPRLELDQLVRQAARADRIRNLLVMIFSKLTLSIAAPLASAANPLDELISESQETVLRAVEKFDPERGFRFSTYLTHSVRRRLLRFLQRRQRERQRTFSLSDEFGLPDAQRWTPAYERRVTRSVEQVELLLQALKPRDRYVIRSRFGWGREFEPRTLQDIADELNVTRERVRQLERRALQRLAALAAERNLDLP